MADGVVPRFALDDDEEEASPAAAASAAKPASPPGAAPAAPAAAPAAPPPAPPPAAAPAAAPPAADRRSDDSSSQLVSLDLGTPPASRGESAFLAAAVPGGGAGDAGNAVAAPGDAAALAVDGSAPGGSAASALGALSSSLSHLSASDSLLMAPPAEIQVATQPQQPAVPATQPLPPDALIKVLVKDVERDPRSRLSAAFGGASATCVVRSECGSASALAAAPADGGSGHVRTFEVRRRLDDFDALARLLKAHYRGFFFPRLPGREWLGSDLKARRVDLQDYLAAVANHPVLQQRSEELRLFLTAPDDLASTPRWQHMVAHRPAALDALLGRSGADGSPTAAAGGTGNSDPQPANTQLGFGLRFKQLMHAVQPKALSRAQLPPDELQLQEAKESLKELQQHLSGCVEVVRSLVAHSEALSDDFGHLGRTLCGFARFEEGSAARQGLYTPSGASASQRGVDLQQLGLGALRQHSLSKQFVVTSGAALVVLHDYYSLIPEAIATLQEREDALDAVQLLADELREKQAAVSRVGSLTMQAGADKRLAALNAAVRSLQDKLLAAEQEYRVLKERNQSELARLNLQRAADFRSSLSRFAQAQAQSAAAAAGVWRSVSEQFAAQRDEGSSQAGGSSSRAAA